MVFEIGGPPVRVRWFFTELPEVPFAHCFLSDNWRSDSDSKGELGEIFGRAGRSYHDGSAPGVALSGIPCGDIRRWQGDPSAFEVPLPLSVGQEIWDVVTPCRKPLPIVCPVLTQFPKYDKNLIWALAVTVWATQSQDDVALALCGDALVRAPSWTARNDRFDTYRPTWVAWWTEREVLVSIAGTQGEEQLLLQVLQSVVGPVFDGGFGAGIFWKRAAELVGAELSAAGIPTDRPITFCGHSLGGSVCTILTARERQLRPKRPVRCVTFGEPRTGDTRLRKIVEAAHERIEAFDDVIALLPPDFGIFGWLNGLVVNNVLQAWQRYDYSSTGRMVDEHGIYSVPDRGLELFGSLAEIIALFVANQPITLPDFHYLNQYARILKIAADINNPPAIESCFSLVKLNQAYDVLKGLIPPAVEIVGNIPARLRPVSSISRIDTFTIAPSLVVSARPESVLGAGFVLPSTARLMLAPASLVSAVERIYPAARLAIEPAAALSLSRRIPSSLPVSLGPSSNFFGVATIPSSLGIGTMPNSFLSYSILIVGEVHGRIQVMSAVESPLHVIAPQLRLSARPASVCREVFNQLDVLTTIGPGEYTVPAGVYELFVEVRAGGGAGQEIGGTSDKWGGGGSSYAAKTFAVAPGEIYGYMIGTGGNRSGSINDPDGDPSYFAGAMLAAAVGGIGGIGGGQGGQASASFGDTVWSGGNGDVDIFEAGGGGACGGPSGEGNSASGQTGGAGDGDSGGGGLGRAFTGDDGEDYGGGGGGAASGTVGRGAQGSIHVHYIGP